VLLSFTACGKGAEEGAELPSAEEIIAGVIEASDGIKTYQFDMDMNMDMAGEVEGEVFEATIAIDLSGAIDLENRQMIMDVTMSIVVTGEEEIEMAVEMYLIGDMVYTMVEDPEMDSIWSKSEMPEGYWEQMNQVEPQLELLEVVQVEVVGSEKVGDVDCYVLKLTPDMEQLWQLAMQQSGMAGEGLLFRMLTDVDEEFLQEVFKSFSVKQWIAKDTYLLARAEMDIAMELTPEAMGFPEEEGLVTMDTAVDLLAYSYNQPVSIVLPPEAEGATEVPMG
jgi:hypothetical protein